MKKRCIRCEDVVDQVSFGGLCDLCVAETTTKSSPNHEKSVVKNKKKERRNGNHPQAENQMKSENEKSEAATPDVPVDDTPGVVFTIPKGITPPLAEIYIRFFERDEGLLAELNAAAELNRRTLQNEILFRLDAPK